MFCFYLSLDKLPLFFVEGDDFTFFLFFLSSFCCSRLILQWQTFCGEKKVMHYSSHSAFVFLWMRRKVCFSYHTHHIYVHFQRSLLDCPEKVQTCFLCRKKRKLLHKSRNFMHFTNKFKTKCGGDKKHNFVVFDSIQIHSVLTLYVCFPHQHSHKYSLPLHWRYHCGLECNTNTICFAYIKRTKRSQFALECSVNVWIKCECLSAARLDFASLTQCVCYECAWKCLFCVICQHFAVFFFPAVCLDCWRVVWRFISQCYSAKIMC